MATQPMLTKFRKHVASVLEPALGVKIKHGKIDGPIERDAAACIYSQGTQQVEGQVDDQLLVLTVRVFNPHRRRRAARKPVDVGDALEEMGELIQVTWRSHILEGGVWFSWVTQVEFDHDLQMVEAQIVAQAQNLAILA